jgi:hypothetical protein
MADLNRMAHRLVKEATEPRERTEPTPAQVNGRNGGLKGGAARADKLSPERALRDRPARCARPVATF